MPPLPAVHGVGAPVGLQAAQEPLPEGLSAPLLGLALGERPAEPLRLGRARHAAREAASSHLPAPLAAAARAVRLARVAGADGNLHHESPAAASRTGRMGGASAAGLGMR